MVERAKDCVKSRQERIEEGRQAEQKNEPGLLDPRSAREHECGYHRQGNDPERARQFDRDADRQRGRAIFTGGTHHGAGVVNG